MATNAQNRRRKKDGEQRESAASKVCHELGTAIMTIAMLHRLTRVERSGDGKADELAAEIDRARKLVSRLRRLVLVAMPFGYGR